MNDGFYRAFEERYYAPREVIKTLRKKYLPFVHPIAELYPGADVFDAGCGRGEWLELMVELNLTPHGVDLDDGMLLACVERGLPATKGDAISHIATLENDSQAVVTAFHVVEHISFNQLRTLVAEALRVLKPGGLLIMETPNPENIVVATRNFYLDPTHQRPIPSMLLSFVVEFAGFARVKMLRLQESEELLEKNAITLQDVFSGVSPDYAVVAQKNAPNAILELTAYPFSLDYGLSLENLIGRWDDRFAHTQSKAQKAERKAQEAESKAQEAESKAQQAESKAQQAESKAQQAESLAQEAWARAEQARSESDYSRAQLIAVSTSTSWRITKPLRWTVDHLRDLRKLRFKIRVKQHSKRMLLWPIRYVSDHPRLKRPVLAVATRFGVLSQLRRMYWASQVPVGLIHSLSDAPQDLQQLSPRARQIYADLKNLIKVRKEVQR